MRRSYTLDVFSRPWAIVPSGLRRLARETRIFAEPADVAAAAARPQAASMRERVGAQRVGTVDVIPVAGVITQRMTFLTWLMGGTALEELRGALAEAVADPEVTEIVLDIDSPGGVVDGMTEFAADMRAMRGSKRITAIANPTAASAAFWIGTQASEFVVTPSGAVGSVGVYALHMDWSRALDAEGVTPTFITAGEYKVEGNSFEPLGDEARDQIQSEVDHYYRMFLVDVAAGRGTTAKVVADTYGSGRMVMPSDAKQAGMVDRVEAFHSVVRKLERGAGRGSRAEAGAIDVNVEHVVPAETAAELIAALERLQPAATEPTEPPAAEADPAPVPTTSPDPQRVAALASRFASKIAQRRRNT